MIEPAKSRVRPPSPQETALLGSKKAISRRDMLLRCGAAVGALTLPGCTAQTTPISAVSGGVGSGSSSATAPTYVRSAMGTSGGFGSKQVTASFSNDAAAGDFLVLAVSTDGSNNGAAPSLNPSGWTSLQSGILAAGASQYLYIFVYPSAPANFQSVTATFTVNGAYSAILVEIAPASGSTVTLDVSGTANGTTTAGSQGWSVPTSASTTQSSELMLGFISNKNQTISFDNPYSALFSTDVGNTTNAELNGATTNVTSQAVQTMTGALAGNAYWVAALLALYTA